MARLLPTLGETLLGALIVAGAGGLCGGVATVLGAHDPGRLAALGFLGSGALLAICWPIWHRSEVRRTVANVADALDYHEGYLVLGTQAPEPDYVGLWYARVGMLEKEPALREARLATARAFDALAQVRDGSQTPYEALLQIRRAQGFLRRALNGRADVRLTSERG